MTPPLLTDDEPPAFEIINEQGSSSAVLICDHASNRIPRQLGDLGLDARHLSDHIAWDPGAAEVARRLSERLDAPLVLSGYSRLVIDCNRQLHVPQSIPEQSAGVTVPGNLKLSAQECQRRIERLFRPYHDAVDRLLDARAGRTTVLLSIHSFTPDLNGEARPWHVGVSPGRDRRLADLMREALSDGPSLVGDNQPYPIDPRNDYSIPMHGDGRGLAGVMIEIRQDRIGTDAGAQAWATRLEAAYRKTAGRGQA